MELIHTHRVEVRENPIKRERLACGKAATLSLLLDVVQNLFQPRVAAPRAALRPGIGLSTRHPVNQNVGQSRGIEAPLVVWKRLIGPLNRLPPITYPGPSQLGRRSS
jgi:hypothetical protein